MNIRHPLRRQRKKGDTAQLAAQLAPLEEQNAQAALQQGANGRQPNNGTIRQDRGALIVDTDHLNLPKEFTERRGGEHIWQIEPVVIVIVIAALLFIAFVAWKVSEMPLVP